MNKEKITQFDRIKIFLYEYYFGYGIYFSVLRIIGGPLILMIGFYLYFIAKTRFGISYGGFMIFFGIYYLLKPLILILTRKAWFRNFDLDYRIENEKIIIKSDKSKSGLDFSDLKTVKKRKAYFALKTISKQQFYLPIKYLKPSEIDILNNLKNN
ncbi:hypothetical protein [Aequorivita echinoideorum]|uniref:YcxB-like protein n=1 Tax=Aequorivita echinoideorum TaxID=1549647 RepID=A0ABS5S6H1_9FLAO|nr:hypothetical protein [Aequorivita echinoideorum]MBT0608797.1 hypothetical protein [Aequorivita echinoideorum]